MNNKEKEYLKKIPKGVDIDEVRRGIALCALNFHEYTNTCNFCKNLDDSKRVRFCKYLKEKCGLEEFYVRVPLNGTCKEWRYKF
ncbi:hypothetical protein M0R19_05655 [Candidatus Pacearchaeota archaeon]|nr:hypothetical protein [Candidatus Pacearchaeota archaeon]